MSNIAFTSNTAHLPDGIDIFYTDSGPPPGSTDYTTVIILHGTAFSGENLKKLHSYAHAFNLRTVIWNRRDYAGSSKFTSEDLDDLKHGRKAFLDRLGIQIAQFLLWFIEQFNVPRVRVDRRTGGFAVMGWSMGNATAITLFSHKDLLTPQAYEVLGSYVKDLIIYDATLFAFGWKPTSNEEPPITYEPLSTFSTTDTPEEIQRKLTDFHAWLSSYYDHPENPESVSELHLAKRTEHATSDSWTVEELESFHDYDTFIRSEMPMYQPNIEPTIRELSARVLGLEDPATMAFPNCPIIYLRPTRTTWRCYWFGVKAKRIYDEHRQIGKNVRTAIFLPIEGGNHFAHWDMPQKVMEAVALGIRGAAV